MSKFIYLAIFHPEIEAGGYSVTFPDLPGCVTEGDTLSEALEMASDALGIYLSSLKDDMEEFPRATCPDSVQTEKGEFISLVEWDDKDYTCVPGSTAVEKELTIPDWLNNLATERNINFSDLFQTALMRELNVANP